MLLEKKHQRNKQKNKRGAPEKRGNEKKASNGLTFEQKKQVKEVAAEMDISEAKVLRMAWDWFYSAREASQILEEANRKAETIEEEELHSI